MSTKPKLKVTRKGGGGIPPIAPLHPVAPIASLHPVAPIAPLSLVIAPAGGKPRIVPRIRETPRGGITMSDSSGDNFSSLSMLNGHISELIQNNVFFMFLELLKKISHDYQDQGITLDELKTRYLLPFEKDLNQSNLLCELMPSDLETIDLTLKQELSIPSPTGTEEGMSLPFKKGGSGGAGGYGGIPPPLRMTCLTGKTLI